MTNIQNKPPDNMKHIPNNNPAISSNETPPDNALAIQNIFGFLQIKHKDLSVDILQRFFVDSLTAFAQGELLEYSEKLLKDNGITKKLAN